MFENRPLAKLLFQVLDPQIVIFLVNVLLFAGVLLPTQLFRMFTLFNHQTFYLLILLLYFLVFGVIFLFQLILFLLHRVDFYFQIEDLLFKIRFGFF